MALYTGINTKLFLDRKDGKNKPSFLDSTLNKLIIGLVVLNVISTLLLVGVGAYFQVSILCFFHANTYSHKQRYSLTHLINTE